MNRHAVPNAIRGLPGRPANGGSRPRFYDFDDGVTRLAKWFPSRHGAKATYSELVASRLGQLIGAPILRGMVVFLPDDIIPAEHRPDGAREGFHFGVAWMDGENFVPTKHYAEIENTAQLPLAAVHLAWLAVGDQEGHNQYLEKLEIRRAGFPPSETKRFKLIDMGQMFGNFAWTAAGINGVPPAYRLPTHLAAALTLDKLAPAIADLRAVSDADIRECFGNCPDEWGVDSIDRDAAIARLLAARDDIERIIRDGNPGLK